MIVFLFCRLCFRTYVVHVRLGGSGAKKHGQRSSYDKKGGVAVDG